jgi:hypothetical protein
LCVARQLSKKKRLNLLDKILTQLYCCVKRYERDFMIPKLVSVNPGVPWAILPPGVHTTTLAEVEAHFATTPYRLKLFRGFVRATEALASAGCTNVFLDGSFVSGKPRPEDFDGCWDPTGVDPARLDPVLLDFTNERREQKKKYLGEMFIAVYPAAPGTIFLDFFQVEKHSGTPKGILHIPITPKKGGP